MTREWSERDDELLEQLLTGDLAPDDPVATAAFAENPELRRQFDELQAVQGELDESAAADEEDERPREPAADLLRRNLHHVPATSSGSSPRRVWLGVAAAAVVLIGLSLAFGEWGSTPKSAEELYLNLSVGELHPSDEYDGGPFVWKLDVPLGGRIELSIYDPKREQRLAHATLEPTDTSWTPDSAQLADFLPKMIWELVVYDAEDTPESFTHEISWR